MLGFGATFLAICQKWRPFIPQFWKKNFWEHICSLRGYARDFFSPISGLQDHQFQFYGPLSDGVLDPGAPFMALCQKRRPFIPQFWKKNSGNILYHEEDTLGISLKSFSGLQDHQFPFYMALSNGTLGSGASFLASISKFEALCTLILGKKICQHH